MPTAPSIKQKLAQAIKTKLTGDKTTISAFAKELGTDRTAVRRILDPHNTAITLATMTKAAHAAGLELTLSIRKLSTNELLEIADHVVGSSPEEFDKIEQQFLEGVYGKPLNQITAEYGPLLPPLNAKAKPPTTSLPTPATKNARTPNHQAGPRRNITLGGS